MFNFSSRIAAANSEMTDDMLRKVAPSIFATEPWSEVSAAYKFIPTFEILKTLRKEGFVPVKAMQSRSRIEGKGEFTKHMIRLRPVAHLHGFGQVLGQEIPEIVLTNSHDRTSGYQLDAGIFRLACLNGMVVKSSDMGSIKVRHSGKNIIDDVIEGSYQIIEEMPRVIDQVEGFKSIALTAPESLAFANAAIQLRYPTDEAGNDTSPITPERLLAVRRNEDRANTLWSTFNRVQENFIKGGLRGTNKKGGRMTTRAVNSVNEDLRLNKALWQLAESMKQLKS